MRIAIIGGGAAGFFLGAHLSPPFFITIFEKSAQVLQKVRVSGGGRCNVTNATFQVGDLVQNYPRGNKELRSVFSRYQPKDTLDWFATQNVPLKTEADGRIFPTSDSSSSIIEALVHAAQKNKVQVHTQSTVVDIKAQDSGFMLKTREEELFFDKVCICSGSSTQMWRIIEELGHEIVPAVPSLFTFNCTHELLTEMQGTVIENAEVQIAGSRFRNTGNLLITHWGLSGPAVIVLSAHAARHLAEMDYKFEILINFVGMKHQPTLGFLKEQRHENNKKSPYNTPLFSFTKRFWRQMLIFAGIKSESVWQDLSDKQLNKLAEILTRTSMQVHGKSTHKEEFVTAGGVSRKEIDFKTMESKLVPGLYFAGEVIDIDAVTGGFNFQACWSEAYIIAETLKMLGQTQA